MHIAFNEDRDPSPLPAATEQQQHVSMPPGFVATRLVALLSSKKSLCYVALGEGAATRIAEAVGALLPDIKVIVFPPWDCLPFDRVSPSRHCMGRRMDALRIWNTPDDTPRLFVTSLDAALQRVPPASIIADSRFELTVGERFDREAFSRFIGRTGYVEEGVADDPGELAVREGVIDVYPAGAPGPMRIMLSQDDHVLELRGFDRRSQRTESSLDRVSIGPASEAILNEDIPQDLTAKAGTMEQTLCRLYDKMPSVFDRLGDTAVIFAAGTAERVGAHLDLVEDASQSRKDFGETDSPAGRSVYLSRDEWDRLASSVPMGILDLEEGGDLQTDMSGTGPRKGLAKVAQDRLQEGWKVLIAGGGNEFEALCRRLAKATGAACRSVHAWTSVLLAEPGALLNLSCDLEQGFIDARHKIIVFPALHRSGETSNTSMLLAEPELRIGDVVVHEDHGVGVLKGLESISVEDTSRDAARLEYRDGNSVLVPMEEFGRLSRYGSEPDAVTLDRLHTDAWVKKQEKIAKDIQATARHLLAIAKQRQTTRAPAFVPARARFSAFTRRFPYPETRDQTAAIRAVISDLASGRPMNRLVCGDVGFGKTEIALRAAAAVAFAGGQVIVIAPTTVLARQHYSTFKRRFAGTDVSVAMLSRLIRPADSKQVKASLADGEIGVIIATQAILAKDVRFANLGLLIIDEEHRFGLKEKRAMNALAPDLHTLAMSATPIPRTLQLAKMGVQEVSILSSPPSKRRPVRTFLAPFDRASLRTGLMRENRRGGQSFVVVPRIEDIEEVAIELEKIVPQLSVKIAHGQMPAAAIDEAIVGFADGEGDVLLATNIIENGLDVPRANTMFVWRAERFGLAQLHQLRGRVGRGTAQGVVTLLTQDGIDLPEDTLSRLLTLVENDRLGSGLSISLRDLDLRGAGDIAGEDQAGHMKAIGGGLYQQLLSRAVAKVRKQPSAAKPHAVLNIGMTGSIPADYVSDPAVRLNLYAKLFKTSAPSEVDDLEEEFEDRFGEPHQDVVLLLRLTKLQIAAGKLGIAKLEAGPKALAMTLSAKTPKRTVENYVKASGAIRREKRLIFEHHFENPVEQLRFFEQLMSTMETSMRLGQHHPA